MNEIAGFGERLRRSREWAGFSQHDAASVTGIARELISYWETGRRTPSLVQLAKLAGTYGTTASYLLGTGQAPSQAEEHALLYRDIDARSARTRAEVNRWLAFLDDWANLRAERGEDLPGRGAPPKPWLAPQAVTDSRRAARLASKVREYYHLGSDAIPDLVAFLDQHDVLVYRVSLDRIDAPGGVSGIFYNHPRLGYCILVNTNTTPGRQTFTLAHEYAHALFHYQATGLVSRAGATVRTETFADAFAAHFLVPTEALHALVTQRELGGVASPYDVIQLQQYFRVSYATMLNRLYSEGFLTAEQYAGYQSYSPKSLAAQLGLDTGQYGRLRETSTITLRRYPPSLLERVRTLVEDEELSPTGAASLLRVSVETIHEQLLAEPLVADTDERREFAELPHPRPPKTSVTRHAGV
ncbi:MAG: XRE family transcriptional regulator [Chloroflexota bacterium]|nr:XRE family transcriptional regulator [Chloroflexota bacterium]